MNVPFVRMLALIFMSAGLSGCLNNMSSSQGDSMFAGLLPSSGSASQGGPIGGHIDQYMDANDKIKLSRGMDGALGKTTNWTNPMNGNEFAITPISKANITGSRFCRTYNVTMEKKGVKDQVNGTACIGEDGAWHVV